MDPYLRRPSTVVTCTRCNTVIWAADNYSLAVNAHNRHQSVCTQCPRCREQQRLEYERNRDRRDRLQLERLRQRIQDRNFVVEDGEDDDDTDTDEWEDDDVIDTEDEGEVNVVGDRIVGEFYVERILAHADRQTERGDIVLCYLIKWRGYPHTENTWEPHEEIVRAVPEMIEQYWQNELN